MTIDGVKVKKITILQDGQEYKCKKGVLTSGEIFYVASIKVYVNVTCGYDSKTEHERNPAHDDWERELGWRDQDLTDAENSLLSAGDALDSAQLQLEQAEREVRDAQQAYDANPTQSNKEALDRANLNYQSESANCNSAKESFDSALASYESAKKAYDDVAGSEPSEYTDNTYYNHYILASMNPTPEYDSTDTITVTGNFSSVGSCSVTLSSKNPSGSSSVGMWTSNYGPIISLTANGSNGESYYNGFVTSDWKCGPFEIKY